MTESEELPTSAYAYVDRFGIEKLYWLEKAKLLIKEAEKDGRHYEAEGLVRRKDVEQLIDDYANELEEKGGEMPYHANTVRKLKERIKGEQRSD